MASEEEQADEAAAKECGDIHQAAFRGNLPALRHWLRVAPASVHEKESLYGNTPLHVAAYWGNVEAAELLLSKGAAVDATNLAGKTPLDLARKEGHKKVVRILLNLPAKKPPSADDGDPAIFWAVGDGDVESVRRMLRADPGKVHQKLSTGDTPLHLAAAGRVAVAKLLLTKGAAVDAKNNDRQTPLHMAAAGGEQKAAELLLSKGAVVDSKDNDGKTPLDLAREGGHKETEQILLKRSAKKPSAEDGKTPPDLSSKGKTKKEPLPTAADKTSEDATPHAAGSGAVAVKHQRETSKEEAAKALKKAMESGNVDVLKEAIAVAKEQKVSQEDMLEAIEKYMALKESAATSKAEKSVTTSKAESSVKLEPGNGARLAMFSARFNARNKETETKFRAVHKLLVENQYEVLMVEAGEGESFGDLTAQYLGRLKRENGIMLAVCTSDYGEMTDSPFCTYYELKSAVEYKIDVLPLQVEDEWQPKPPSGKGHLDEHHKALGFIDLVFTPSRVRLDCRDKPVAEIASKIAAILRKPV